MAMVSEQRHLAAISKFTTDIHHIAGKSNTVAISLLHVPVSPVLFRTDFSALAAEQPGDTDILLQQFVPQT